MKVIIVTIAACQKMQELDKYKELADTLTEIFDQIGKCNRGVILCLNIHANRTKVQLANNDKVSEKIWQHWRYDDDQFDSDGSIASYGDISFHSEMAK